MTELVRITKHPSDREVVLLHTPPGVDLGRFGPARLSREHRAFLLHHDHIPAFYRFARTAGLHVTDERATSSGARTLPVECARCGQGGSLGSPPTVCPACGEPWVGVPPPVKAGVTATHHECGRCKHKQRGRFSFCSACGEPMTYPEVTSRRPEGAKAPARPKLRDPVPVGDVMRDAVLAQQALGRTPMTRTPLLPPVWHDGRPIENVNLPEPRDEDAPPPDDEPPPEPEPAW